MMKRPTQSCGHLAWLLVLLAGCDSGDPPGFKLPRLTGLTYISATVDTSDSAFANVEMTNVGSKPVSNLMVCLIGQSPDVPPINNLMLAPSETKQIGRIRLMGEGEPTQIMIVAKDYFPQFIFICQQPNGKIETTEDGYAGHQGFGEYMVRREWEKANTESRSRTFYTIFKVGGVIIVSIAVVVIAIVVGIRRGPPQNIEPR
jgi:hypothetical protein